MEIRSIVNYGKYKLKIFYDQNIVIETIDENYNILIKEDYINVNETKIKNINYQNLIIYNSNNCLELFFDNTFVLKINKIKDINLNSKNYYNCSINLPISLKNVDVETLINFDYTVNKYLNYSYQINILHTDSDIDILDNFILSNSKLNYIYVENPFKFNLGYTRNLYKYLNLSNNILFADVDIPVDKMYIDIMIMQIKNYDIIKPYDKNLIQLDREEKYK